jgi:hypothetical protein
VVAALALGALVAPCAAALAQVPLGPPRSYTVYRAAAAPRVDGALDDAAWRAAPWSQPFGDIEGAGRLAPRFATRVKMLWDAQYLYVAAELQESDVWGTIRTRDSVIFRDNDFEMFIDPDGDAKAYAELEINALNTVWDLFLDIPYRDGGHADDAWDIAGLRTAVQVQGTLNRAGDRDRGWTVEMAIPWASLARASHTSAAPHPGDTWRINFSRVEWDVDTAGGTYRKVPGVSEHNWVWSPQGMIDMHQPERWGYVRFSTDSSARLTSETTGAAPPAALSGFRTRLAGALLDYHSAHPDADTALLARARREVQSVRWETDTVAATAGDSVTFVWLTALSGSKGVYRFDLLVDGRPCFTFAAAPDSTVRDWTVPGCGGTLHFAVTMVDRFGDLFGWMWLRLPRGMVHPGAPLVLEVRGEDAGSNAWYMTFAYRLSRTPHVRQDPVLVRGRAGPEAALRIVVDNLGAPAVAEVEVAGGGTVRRALGFGGTVLVVPGGATPRDARLVVRLDGVPALDTVLHLVTVPPRDVYVLSYSHNDIGYSDLQPVVERKQWHNFDDALDLVDRTRDYPDDARFRWNVEMLWPVESWLSQASPEQRARFRSAVRAGSIGLNGFLAGMLTGLSAEPTLFHSLDEARRLRARDSLPVTTALVDDIPGQSWGIVPALAQSGIRYLAMGPNPSDRVGYFLSTWGDRPFWWVSQSGRDSVLTWVAGASYASFHMAPMRVIGERVMYQLLRRLDAQGYPYEQVQLPYTVDGDNGPPDATLPDFVRDWNARYVSPRLIIATHARMFADLVSRHGLALPAFAGDMTGYWEDGAASTAFETALARAAADRLVQAQALAAMRGATFDARAADSAWRDVVLWDEHTWGAAASIETPDAPDVVAQWEYKRRFVTEADSISRALLERVLAVRDSGRVGEWESGREAAGGFEVFNTSDAARTDLVLVPAALSRAGDRVTDPSGRAVPSQRLSTGELAVLVRDLPARSQRRYTMRAGRPAAGGRARAAGRVLRTPALSAVVDTVTGAVASLVWSARGVELVDRSHRAGLGEYLYVPGSDTARAVGIRRVRVRVVEPGPLVAILAIEADSAPGARRVVRELRVVDGLDRLDLSVTVDKLPVRTKEGVHLAFPLNIVGGQVRFDVASAVVRPDSDQLAGTARNVLPVQSWVDVSNDSVGVTWATVDAPLVEVGGLNAEQPWMRALPSSGTFYSYVMNNYWHTNYKAEQSGPVTFRYALRPHGRFIADEALRFGRERRQPLLVGPMVESTR